MTARRQLVSRLHDQAKPRVLLVDDHPELLASVSALLADDFDVVGLAEGGAQALALARDLNPDLIVLDVTMPGFDGFQTIQALHEQGSQAPVIFLSLHDTADYVDEAFARGARGYVLKTRARTDLPSAIDQVLAGRQFSPSVTSLLRLFDGTSGHAMLTHGANDLWLDPLAAFFELALKRGDATCIVAPEAHRDGLIGRLRARGWDVGGSSSHDRFLAIDAEEALSRFMRDGMPVENLLAPIAVELEEFRRGTRGTPAGRLTIFGNMSGTLTLQGNTKGAVALEHLWTKVTIGLPIFTVCGYSTECFHEHTPASVFTGVCDAHVALSHTPGV